MFYSVETKAFRDNETLYRECGHRHQSLTAAIRCKKRIINRKPEPGIVVAFVDLRLGGVK